VHKFVKLRAAIRGFLTYNKEKHLATMLKIMLPALPRALMITQSKKSGDTVNQGVEVKTLKTPIKGEAIRRKYRYPNFKPNREFGVSIT